MKRRWNRTLAAVAAAAGIVLAGTVPAAAYSSEAVPQETGETAGPAGEEKMETGGPLEENRPGPAETTPFSKPGNGSLVDDAGGDGTKQFLSVQTKNGNMFYIVVDRSGSTGRCGNGRSSASRAGSGAAFGSGNRGRRHNGTGGRHG